MVIGVRDPAVVLFLILVLLGIGSWVAPQPEILYKSLLLLICFEPLESLLLFIRNDVDDVLVHPLLPRTGELFFQLLLLLSYLLLREWLGDSFSGATAAFRAFFRLRVQRTCKEQSRRRDADRRVRAEGKGKLHRINDL